MINLSLDLLKVFYMVATTGNLTKAASMLYISQPAVSQSIKKLEEELGGALFFRNNKGIKLTEEGKMFYNYIKDAFLLIDKAHASFLSYKNIEQGCINIGISTVLAKLILAEHLQKFHDIYPNIKINIYNDLTSNLVNKLNNGILDLVIINSGEESYSNFTATNLCLLDYAFVYNQERFSFIKKLSIKEIQSLPLILQERNSNTRNLIENYFDRNEIIIKPCLEVVSQELVKFLSLEGLGVGFIYKDLIYNDSLLKEVPIDFSISSANILLLENKNKGQSFASIKFKEFLIKNF